MNVSLQDLKSKETNFSTYWSRINDSVNSHPVHNCIHPKNSVKLSSKYLGKQVSLELLELEISAFYHLDAEKKNFQRLLNRPPVL